MPGIGGKRTPDRVIIAPMRRFSGRWLHSRWKLIQSLRAERSGDFDRAICLIDEAGEIAPLKTLFWVRRANLLLRLERGEEASYLFDEIRQHLEGSTKAERRYLYHYCAAMLSLMQPKSSQWRDHAKEANAIKGVRYLKGLFPMVSDFEAEAVKSRRR